ncbi:protease pro-enzyme activation domain-containing protein [Stygiolobus caldivivus]|uniref:Peptidase S53 n=1 Tax=Stygiolobus caldivivus TaxID=2824673 RepID=A0A8D5U9T4_9CREN|nr:protease pro-enzyme activation domain-containing protein [Stygiolobus caldivivus]BCU71498.1 peptidase S53 [Stygiolobus caldivivus]
MKRYSIFLILVILISSIQLLTAISSTNSMSIITNSIPPKGFRIIGTLPQNYQLTFTIFIPLKNVNLLYYYAYETSNPSSPLYHHFLSKSQVERLFYPTAQFKEVLSFLREHGFNVEFTSADSVIVASGTVGMIEKYLGVTIKIVSNGTVRYYYSLGRPTIDAYIVATNVSNLFFDHPSTLVTQKTVQKLIGHLQQPNYTAPIEAYWPNVLQKVYNETPLFAKGYMGQNYTIGILDFYGDPYIYQQLVDFDKVTGLPNPPNFTVVPIGPYNPGLGIETGWAGEISLDVEVSHTVAPRAGIVLYIANPNCLLPTIISYIVSQDRVDVLSQSFSIPESSISTFSGQLFYTCIVLSDEYYAMGSAEGISFFASSGDAGGSGYSNGPIGTVGYPAVSPFVTSAGGTTTYVQFPNGSYYQTAWSNYGFVPNGVNYGGSSGGISIIEPKPWYQWGLPTPASYPNGREVPDISANADVYPGIYIICPFNITEIIGGTSEASPLLAGMTVTLDSYLHKKLGMLNPVIYELASNSSIYSKVFYPITFGYNIPWTANYGYNLVTGWGSINLGNLAHYIREIETIPSLSIEVNVLNSSGGVSEEFMPGQTMIVTANITYNNVTVSQGKFSAVLEDVLGNITEVKLSYDNITKLWVGKVKLPADANGIIYVTVYGNYSGIGGEGFTETFSGYYMTFELPISLEFFDSQVSPYVVANVTNVYGQMAPNTTVISVSLYSYNITDNKYTFVGNLSLEYSPEVGAWLGELPNITPIGDDLLIGDNAYGYVAFSNGIYLQSLFVLPQIIAEPGGVAGGQYILIEGLPTFQSTNLLVQTDVTYGSNVTAELLSPSGTVVSKSVISLTPSGILQGYLYVPKNVTQGLYTILLFASYDSYTLDENLSGYFYGQVYIVPKPSVPIISTSNYAIQGQVLYVYANITYPNGTEVTQGMYSATVFPSTLKSEYPNISTVLEIPLWYNPSLGLWEGNTTLPSSSSLGNYTYLSSTTYFATPFDVLVTGVSYDGVPTSNGLSNAHTFYILPYTLVTSSRIDAGQTYNAYLKNDTIVGNVTLLNDIIVDDTINGNVIITSSNVSNVLILDSHVTILGSEVEGLKAINSTITFVQSHANNLYLTNSKVSTIGSTINNITPALPSIQIQVPSENLTGVVPIKVTITGRDISQNSIYINNILLTNFSGNTYTYQLDTYKYPDGTYKFTVVSYQSDGLMNETSISIQIQNQLVEVSHNLNNLNQTVSSISSSVTSNSDALKTEQEYIIVSLVLAIIAVIIGLAAFLTRRK